MTTEISVMYGSEKVNQVPYATTSPRSTPMATYYIPSFFSHNPQASTCYLYNKAPPDNQPYAPDDLISIYPRCSLFNIVTLRNLLLQLHSPSLLLQQYFRILSTATLIIIYPSTAIFPIYRHISQFLFYIYIFKVSF